MIIAFLKHSYLFRELNKKHITLIPKKDNPRKVIVVISLCNFTYKLILELLANRLHLVLPKLISASHSAIVSGRDIHGNTLVAHEILSIFVIKK